MNCRLTCVLERNAISAAKCGREWSLLPGLPAVENRSHSVSSFGIDCFNADDRAAQLNNASYQAIPVEIRVAVNEEFERFVLEHKAESGRRLLPQGLS
jgi:hypothetical protein